MSPRRSSRARSSQNPPSSTSHTNSSSSQTSNTKADRNSRSMQTRAASPRGASAARSDSLDDAESTSRSAYTAESSLPPRRSRRANGSEVRDKQPKLAVEEDDEVDEEAVEEEITRCICTHTEYPGPGASVREQLTSPDPISDDVGNFFVQCDKCHVWQHGGCMGLIDENIIPDEYYCEKCKPEFHKILKSPNNTKSSRYLPVLEGAPSLSSPPRSTDGPKKANGKNKLLESTKRRATMNSRGAYDEDEMLRRAIEESREMGTLGKRARDDNDESKVAAKRQRTASSVSSLGSRRSTSPAGDNEETNTRSSSNENGKNANRLRGTAAKNNREKERREQQKEQVAAQRAEAANKRNARSERRRGEDSPPPTPSLSPSKAVQTVGGSLKPKAETPPVGKAAQQRKGGRPPARRGRLGRNQYTRDMPPNGDTSDSPMRDAPYDRNADSPRPFTNGNINGESGRSSKAKIHPARTSMNEMKRRVAAILEFVGHMQAERGSVLRSKHSSDGNASGSSGNSSFKGNSTPNGTVAGVSLPTANLVQAVAQGLEEANGIKDKATEEVNEFSESETAKVPTLDIESEKEFFNMNAIEMMETLTKDLVTWQSLYGMYVR